MACVAALAVCAPTSAAAQSTAEEAARLSLDMLLGGRLFRVPSESMHPTLKVGETFRARVISDRAKEVRPGAIVVFTVGDERNVYFKRVVALGGDRVQMIGGRLHINGVAAPRERLADRPDPLALGGPKAMPCYRETLAEKSYEICEAEGDKGILDDTAEFRVPEGHAFVLGDNRDNSVDSRQSDQVGFVPLARMRFIYEPRKP
jgi:signal peptidase I